MTIKKESVKDVQIEAVFNNLKVAPGIGQFVKCEKCNGFISDPGEEEITLSRFVKDMVYGNGWRYGYLKNESDHKGMHCPDCSSKENFVEITK